MKLQKMKYQRLVCNTTPSSLQDWLDEKLDSLGIDGVYTRYILSLLQQDSMDVDPFESHYLNLKTHQQKVCHKDLGPEVLHCGIKNKHQKWKTWSKQVLLTSNSFYRNATLADIERMRKKAAVECLKSLTDDVEDIESLIDEVCIRLKNIRNSEVDNDESSGRGVKAMKRKTCFNFPPSSPTDEAEKYFAAFPPLNGNPDQSTELNHRKYLKSNAENFWCGKCQKKISKPEDNLDINLEQYNFDRQALKENTNSFVTLIPYDSLKVMGNVRKSDVSLRPDIFKEKSNNEFGSIENESLPILGSNNLTFSPNSDKTNDCSELKAFCDSERDMCLKNRTIKFSNMILMTPYLKFPNLIQVEICIDAFDTLSRDAIRDFLKKNCFAFEKIQFCLDSSRNDSPVYFREDNKDRCMLQLFNKFKNLASIWYDNITHAQEISLASISNANKSSVWSYEGGTLPSLYPALENDSEAIIERSESILGDPNSKFVLFDNENTKIAKNTQNDFTCLSDISSIRIDVENISPLVVKENDVAFSDHSIEIFNVNNLEPATAFLDPRKSCIPYEFSNESNPFGYYSVESRFKQVPSLATNSMLERNFNTTVWPFNESIDQAKLNQWGLCSNEETNMPKPVIAPVCFETKNMCSQIFDGSGNQTVVPFSFVGPIARQSTFSDANIALSHTDDSKDLSFTCIASPMDIKADSVANSHWDNINWNAASEEKTSVSYWMGDYSMNKNIWALDLSEISFSKDNKYIKPAVSCDISEDVNALRKEIKEEEDELLKGLCCFKDASENPISSSACKTEYDENVSKSNVINDMNSYILEAKYSPYHNETCEKEPVKAQEIDCNVYSEYIGEEMFAFDNEYSIEDANFYYDTQNDGESYQYSENLFQQPGAEKPYDDLHEIQEYSENFGGWSKDIGDDFEKLDYSNFLLGNLSNLDQQNEQTDFTSSFENFLSASDIDKSSPRQISSRGLSRRRMKQKHPIGRKPCTFFLEGTCLRNDCRFAHDVSSITCRFWIEGSCFKGDTCPFLHGYTSRQFKHRENIWRVRSNSPEINYTLESEADFPSLSAKNTKTSSSTSQPVIIAPGKGSKAKRKKGKSQSISHPDDNEFSKQEISSSWPGVSKMLTKFD